MVTEAASICLCSTCFVSVLVLPCVVVSVALHARDDSWFVVARLWACMCGIRSVACCLLLAKRRGTCWSHVSLNVNKCIGENSSMRAWTRRWFVYALMHVTSWARRKLKGYCTYDTRISLLPPRLFTIFGPTPKLGSETTSVISAVACAWPAPLSVYLCMPKIKRHLSTCSRKVIFTQGYTRRGVPRAPPPSDGIARHLSPAVLHSFL